MSGTDDARDVELLDDRREYTVAELCEVCRIEPRRLVEYVAHGVVTSVGGAGVRYTHVELGRLVRAVRIGRELEVDVPHLALVMDLVETIERQRRELDLLRRQIGSRE